ncbi:hypothetical protein LIER_11464 [Lithospermum erythrorhizon]|uniref:Uncharacterized protein n=1 Tax=Lithospermum erythrorhizon TaxID=34254 RepID=A0AAV3PQE2_LITER
MNSNGNDNRPQGDDALNLNNPAAGRNEDAPPNPKEPVHIRSGRTPLKECLPQLSGDALAKSSSVREEREETYTHNPPMRMNDDPLTAQPARQEAPTPSVAGNGPTTEVVVSLQKTPSPKELLDKCEGELTRSSLDWHPFCRRLRAQLCQWA